MDGGSRVFAVGCGGYGLKELLFDLGKCKRVCVVGGGTFFFWDEEEEEEKEEEEEDGCVL